MLLMMNLKRLICGQIQDFIHGYQMKMTQLLQRQIVHMTGNKRKNKKIKLIESTKTIKPDEIKLGVIFHCST